MGRPSSRTRTRTTTRTRLLDTAERLFAERGLAGASLRAINAEAGLSPAALHYHFGTQQTLVESLLERRMPALMQRRASLLDAIHRGPDPVCVRDVLGALIRPLAELLAEGGAEGLRYLRLIDRLQADGDLDPTFVTTRYPGGVERLLPLLERALPSTPRTLLQLRLGLAIHVMLRSLAHDTAPSGQGLAAQVEALLDFLTGAFEAPSNGEPV